MLTTVEKVHLAERMAMAFVVQLDEALTDAVGEAVEKERAACAKAVCEGCAEGWPTEELDGDLLHILPEAMWKPTEYGPGNRSACEAAAILART